MSKCCTSTYIQQQHQYVVVDPVTNNTPCINCGQIHDIVPGHYSNNCVTIGGRTHQRSDQGVSRALPSSANATTIPMPATLRQQAMLFDQLWFWFTELKDENTSLRDEFATRPRTKTPLRTQVPLLWLQATRCDGSKGQTRNQEKWEKLWQSLTHTTLPDGRRVPVAWVTVRPFESTPPSSPQLNGSPF